MIKTHFLRILSGDIQRAICSWRFLVSLLVGLLALYQPAYPFGFYGGMQLKGTSLYRAIQDSFGLGIFILLTPVIAALPYGDVHAWELCSCEFSYMIKRTGIMQYIISKIVAVALSGAMALVLPLVFFSLVQYVFFAPPSASLTGLRQMVIESILLMGFGASWSLCSLAFSGWFASPIAVLAFPFCVTRALWLIDAVIGAEILNPTLTIDRVSSQVLRLRYIAAQDIVFATLFAIIFAKGVGRRKC